MKVEIEDVEYHLNCDECGEYPPVRIWDDIELCKYCWSAKHYQGQTIVPAYLRETITW